MIITVNQIETEKVQRKSSHKRYKHTQIDLFLSI